MKKVLILHGTMSSPDSNWFPWLKKELENLDFTVFSPQFPTPVNQTVANWIQVMDQAVGEYNPDTIIIGHSSAPLVICAKLQQLENPVQAVFFVAPFLGNIGVPDYDTANSDFNNYPFDWKRVKKGARKFFIYRSDNDQYVPEKIGKKVASNLNVKEIIIPGDGHLNSETGYDKFPQLLSDIKAEIS